MAHVNALELKHVSRHGNRRSLERTLSSNKWKPSVFVDDEDKASVLLFMTIIIKCCSILIFIETQYMIQVIIVTVINVLFVLSSIVLIVDSPSRI